MRKCCLPTRLGSVLACIVLLICVEAKNPRAGEGGVPFNATIRCRGTLGNWCTTYLEQPFQPTKAAPRGDKDCPKDCSGRGSCDHDFGYCRCPVGWTGEACDVTESRPCTHRWREDKDPKGVAIGHIDKDGRDLDLKVAPSTASRCAGICDATLAFCWCDTNNTANITVRYHAPPGSSEPFVLHGRPMPELRPSSGPDGSKIEWGVVPWNLIYGTKGWCTSAQPIVHPNYGCQLDGIDGALCDELHEMTCPNQCSGRGYCYLGFCHCKDSWYGSDCSRRKAGLPIEPVEVPHWIKSVATIPPPSAADPPSHPMRKRPFIYIYNMPSNFTTLMHSYRMDKRSCTWRHYVPGNVTVVSSWTYGIEPYLHEMLLASRHRTFDPEEADYFYVPAYYCCYLHPVMGWADHPWWGVPVTWPRTMHVTMMLKAAKEWLESAHPWWKRRGGRDHIWLTPHDEGACYVPTDIYEPSIMLTHWGREDANHKSGTGYPADNYDSPVHGFRDFPDWRKLFRNSAGTGPHLCYNASKDLVIPSLKPPTHYYGSPLLGAPPARSRDKLLYFRGDIGQFRDPQYSRGIRQKIAAFERESWREKYKIHVGMSNSAHMPGSYSGGLASSVFCLVLPGDGWSARAEDAILHGCIPVVIMDQVAPVFDSILDWSKFSIRVAEKDVPSLPQILLNITEEARTSMQEALTLIWHRFAYAQGPFYRQLQGQGVAQNFREASDVNRTANSEGPGGAWGMRLRQFPVYDDAFSTIMQWLYARIPATR